MSMNKIKIVSEGVGATTKVYLLQEDGTEIPIHSVAKVTWQVEAKTIAKVTLECLLPVVEVVGECEDDEVVEKWMNEDGK